MTSRQFNMEMQEAFTRLSGDHNPLHLGTPHPRHRLFGGIVVHGVHLAVWGLDCVLRSVYEPMALEHIAVSFHGPVLVGNSADISVRIEADGAFGFEVEPRHCSGRGRLIRTTESCAYDLPLPEHATGSPCRQRSFSDAAQDEGAIPLYISPSNLESQFPHVAARLPRIQVAQILAATRLTGMDCPGMHSVFAGFEMQFAVAAGATCGESGRAMDKDPSPVLCYRVVQSDPRFGLLRLQVEGPGVAGLLSTMFRDGAQASRQTVKP